MDEMRRRMAELRAIVAGGPEGVAENVVPDYIEEFGDVEGIAEEFLEGDNPEEIIEETNEETPELAADEEESLESPAESPEKISREQFEKELLIRAGLRSADGRIESMGEVTELYKKYFNGIDETIASMEELKSLEKNIQSIEVSKPTVPLEYDKLVSELKLAIDKAKSLKDINEKLNEKNKNTEEEKRKEEDLKEKIAKIENKIKELLERLKSVNFKDEDKESIEKEIGELFKELVGYKKELLELIYLLKEDIEKESTELYGAKTTEELKKIRKEDTRRAPADASAPERDSGATSPETGTPERPVAERSGSLGSFGATRSGTSDSFGATRASDGIPTIKLRLGREAEDALWQRMRMPSYCDVENGKFYHAVRVGNELKYIGEKIDKEEYSKKTLIEKMDKILKDMGIDFKNNSGNSVLLSLRGIIGEDDIEKMESREVKNGLFKVQKGLLSNSNVEGLYNEIVGKPVLGKASDEVRMKLYCVLKDIEESKNPYKFFLIPKMLKNIDKPKDIEAYLEASRGMDNVERATEHETPVVAIPEPTPEPKPKTPTVPEPSPESSPEPSPEPISKPALDEEKLSIIREKRIAQLITKGKKLVFKARQEEWNSSGARGLLEFHADYNPEALELAIKIMQNIEDGARMEDVKKLYDTIHDADRELTVMDIVFSYSKKGPEFLEYILGDNISDEIRELIEKVKQENEEFKRAEIPTDEEPAVEEAKTKAEADKAMDEEELNNLPSDMGIPEIPSTAESEQERLEKLGKYGIKPLKLNGLFITASDGTRIIAHDFKKMLMGYKEYKEIIKRPQNERDLLLSTKHLDEEKIKSFEKNILTKFKEDEKIRPREGFTADEQVYIMFGLYKSKERKKEEKNP